MKVRPKTDFTIDASHELALFIYYNGNGRSSSSSSSSSSSNETDYPQNKNNSSTGCDCKNSTNKAKNRYHNDIGNFCKAKCEHEDETDHDNNKTASAVELLTMSKASYFCSKNPQHLNDKCAVFPNAVNRNYCVSETL